MEKADASSSGPEEIVGTLGVLKEEYKRLWPNATQPERFDDYYRSAFENGQAALCLSGGGIRSASFALGVVQALSQKHLLGKFHYLSTVSGGGYLGGWLQRWISVEDGKVERVEAALRQASADASETEAGPGGVRKVEPDQISALRENSNFITPRIGLGSADTWTAVSISIRNIAVNWMLFAPLLLLVTMVPTVFSEVIAWLGTTEVQLDADKMPLDNWHNFWVAWKPGLTWGLFLLFSAFCAARAAMGTCRALPSYRADDQFEPEDGEHRQDRTPFDGDAWLRRKIVLWLLLWAGAGAVTLWMEVRMSLEQWASFGLAIGVKGDMQSPLPGVIFALISFLVTFASLCLSGLRLPAKASDGKNYRRIFRKDLWLWAWTLAFAAMTIPLGCALFGKLTETLGFRDPGGQRAAEWFATLAPLWLMGAQLLIAFIFAAFRRGRDEGAADADADREWLARLSALKIRPMLLWAVLAATVLLFVQWGNEQKAQNGFPFSGLLAVLSGATAVLGGHSGSTGTMRAASARFLRYVPVSAIIAIATFIFAIALIALASAVEHFLIGYVGHALETTGVILNRLTGFAPIPFLIPESVVSHLGLAATLGLILWVLDKRVPVNRFSLNGLYRNRLGRAFLGGARKSGTRKPDIFTGFDARDNIDLHELAPKAGDGSTILYPVINTSLNVTASDNLAWQERKAEPFILSPLYCGSAMLAPEPALRAKMEPSPPPGAAGEARKGRREARSGVYVRSDHYGGSEPEMKRPTSGMSLATAMSISGAAASPNMGYHSSPATAFLMTLFNVRLGQWMPNPACAVTLGDGVYRANPSSSLRALLRELGGATDDKGKDIYLSDGGHFENLALYEMVRRRCQFIVVSDAGADPDCAFTDLGNAIRKVKIDMGIDIEIQTMRISSRNRKIEGQMAWALGDIKYPEGTTGRLLYIKPSFFDRELPIDVVSYAKDSATFPHETTGDQFFSESQFESYRKLGFALASEIGALAQADGSRKVSYPTLKEFFDALTMSTSEETDEDRKLKGGFLRWLRGLRGQDAP